MNILFVNNSYKLFNESDSGASNRTTMFLQALSEVGHVDVISFVNVCKSNIENCDVIYTKEIISSAKHLSAISKLKRVLCSSTIQDIYGFDEEKANIICNILENKHYDYIACRYIHDAALCGLDLFENKLILDVDDSPKTAFLSTIPKNINTFKKLYIRSYADRIDKVCKRFLSKTFCSFYSNPAEKPSEESIFLHNVSLANKEIPNIPDHYKPVILMVGWMVYAPNRFGANLFATKIFPKIKEKIPNAEFRIAGRCEDDFKEEMEKTAGVHVLGYVQKLDKEYENASVVVVPIYQGSGTSIKVVEGMQMNRPVISSSTGVRGLENIIKNGRDYLKADSNSDFANKVIDLLLSDADRLRKLAKNGKQIVDKYYSKERFKEIVTNALAHKIKAKLYKY